MPVPGPELGTDLRPRSPLPRPSIPVTAPELGPASDPGCRTGGGLPGPGPASRTGGGPRPPALLPGLEAGPDLRSRLPDWRLAPTLIPVPGPEMGPDLRAWLADPRRAPALDPASRTGIRPGLRSRFPLPRPSIPVAAPELGPDLGPWLPHGSWASGHWPCFPDRRWAPASDPASRTGGGPRPPTLLPAPEVDPGPRRCFPDRDQARPRPRSPLPQHPPLRPSRRGADVLAGGRGKAS